MLAEQEEIRKHEFESQPGEVKEAIAAAGGGSAVTPVTAPGGGGTEKGGAPGASSVEGASMGEEKPSATEKRAEVSKGEEGAASRETTKQGIHMPTTAAESMGGGVAAPEVPIRMRDVLPKGEVEGGALDMPVTKMDAAAKQREETAQFRGYALCLHHHYGPLSEARTVDPLRSPFALSPHLPARPPLMAACEGRHSSGDAASSGQECAGGGGAALKQ
ncbi:unnamed protein product [Closterium sp. NIES-65]|nr:unnamed protein product [Closterium sp. NIES-65]